MTHPAHVVVAAGGLGTRVRGWSRYLPKELRPTGDGRPGIVHLLAEIAQLGPAHVVVVYHPYYDRLVDHLRGVLAADARARYDTAAGLDAPPGSDVPAGLDVDWIPQAGPYADLTSVTNGTDHLGTDDVLVAFADNLYPTGTPLPDLAALPDGVAVAARPYHPLEASRRGVLVVNELGHLVDLAEKPTAAKARDMEKVHGRRSLALLEGRMRVTRVLVDQLRHRTTTRHTEPKLALAIRDYARAGGHVTVVPIHSPVVDLGTR